MPATDEALVAAAAANNAAWCHAVCRTHGLVPVAAADAWTSAARTPPLYPDAVTLQREVSIPDLLARIDASAGCSIKDSFASLDLESHGFSVLFDAEWIARPPRSGSPGGDAKTGWSVIEDSVAFAEWERAWRGEVGLADVLRPALLAEESVHVLAERDDHDWVVAGAVLNRSSGVVGISNFFVADRADTSASWASCVGIAVALFPGSTLVGYESGAALGVARSHGFDAGGPLRVWIRQD